MAQRRGPACCCLERPALASAALLHLSTTTVLAIDDYEMPLSQREQERRTPSKSPEGAGAPDAVEVSDGLDDQQQCRAVRGARRDA